ncbi:MAG: hypothetical protein AB9866_25120 [Syntrophobacteraceae bacterium]
MTIATFNFTGTYWQVSLDSALIVKLSKAIAEIAITFPDRRLIIGSAIRLQMRPQGFQNL